jgi:hypothetical protein
MKRVTAKHYQSVCGQAQQLAAVTDTRQQGHMINNRET